jgi:RNase P subunit RPR2
VPGHELQIRASDGFVNMLVPICNRCHGSNVPGHELQIRASDGFVNMLAPICNRCQEVENSCKLRQELQMRQRFYTE